MLHTYSVIPIPTAKIAIQRDMLKKTIDKLKWNSLESLGNPQVGRKKETEVKNRANRKQKIKRQTYVLTDQ